MNVETKRLQAAGQLMKRVAHEDVNPRHGSIAYETRGGTTCLQATDGSSVVELYLGRGGKDSCVLFKAEPFLTIIRTLKSPAVDLVLDKTKLILRSDSTVVTYPTTRVTIGGISLKGRYNIPTNIIKDAGDCAMGTTVEFYSDTVGTVLVADKICATDYVMAVRKTPEEPWNGKPILIPSSMLRLVTSMKMEIKEAWLSVTDSKAVWLFVLFDDGIRISTRLRTVGVNYQSPEKFFPDEKGTSVVFVEPIMPVLVRHRNIQKGVESSQKRTTFSLETNRLHVETVHTNTGTRIEDEVTLVEPVGAPFEFTVNPDFFPKLVLDQFTGFKYFDRQTHGLIQIDFGTMQFITATCHKVD